MTRLWWIDKQSIIADILVVMLLVGICTMIYGSIIDDINIVGYGGGILGLFLVLLIVAKKFNKS